MRRKLACRNDLPKYTQQDSNLQPLVPKTISILRPSRACAFFSGKVIQSNHRVRVDSAGSNNISVQFPGLYPDQYGECVMASSLSWNAKLAAMVPHVVYEVRQLHRAALALYNDTGPQRMAEGIHMAIVESFALHVRNPGQPHLNQCHDNHLQTAGFGAFLELAA